MNNFKLLMSLILIFFSTLLKAQFLTSTNTTIQLGWNIIDDNANSYGKLLNKDSWYSDPFPGKLSMMKSINNDLKLELNLGVSKMRESYYGERYLNPGLFTCFDLNLRYQINPFNEFFKSLRRRNTLSSYISQGGITIEPIVGFGYTGRTQTVFNRSVNFNFGLSGTYWVKRNRVGIFLQSLGKLGLDKNIIRTGSNYLHHSCGLVWVVRGKNYYRNFQYNPYNKDKFLY